MKRLSYFVMALLVFGWFGSCTKENVEDPAVSVLAESVKEVEASLLDLVNDYRVSQGLTTLTHSPVAYNYAQEHTSYMIASGQLNHDNFTSRVYGMAQEMNAKHVAENVGKDYPSAQQALDGWLSSPPHRSTILGEFTHTAISVKKDSNGALYFTQLFVLQ